MDVKPSYFDSIPPFYAYRVSQDASPALSFFPHRRPLAYTPLSCESQWT